MSLTPGIEKKAAIGRSKKKDILALIEEGEAELCFRPLTSGLGIGNIDEKKEEFIKQKALQRQQKRGGGRPLKINPSDVNHGELAPFYRDDVAIPVPKVTETPHDGKNTMVTFDKTSKKIDRPLQLASLAPRFFAYLVDIIVILMAMIFTLLAIFFDYKYKLG